MNNQVPDVCPQVNRATNSSNAPKDDRMLLIQMFTRRKFGGVFSVDEQQMVRQRRTLIVTLAANSTLPMAVRIIVTVAVSVADVSAVDVLLGLLHSIVADKFNSAYRSCQSLD